MKKSELVKQIREEINIRDYRYKKMEKLVNNNDLNDFISSSTKIINSLTSGGVQTEDALRYLYNKLNK